MIEADLLDPLDFQPSPDGAGRWLKVVKLSEDSPRAYPLDATAKKQAKIYGSPPLYEPPDYLIL